MGPDFLEQRRVACSRSACRTNAAANRCDKRVSVRVTTETRQIKEIYVMAANDPCVVVLQLTGGNDYLNTMIPYNNPLYRDNRPAVGIADDKMIHLDKDYAIPDYMAPMKKFWDDKKLAVLHGVGFKDSPRSHFRSMDIWHTCEPEKVGTEGWLGRVIQEIDPEHDNVLTGVNFGRGLPRALAKPGVPVASVGALETYGLLTGIEGKDQRA